MHSHILPGVDDGAEDLEDALSMARLAVADGIRTMFATSHSAEWFEIGPREVMEEQVKTLQTALDAASIELKVISGMEIFLSADTLEHLKSGRAWTLGNSHYILIELAYDNWPPNTERVLFELQIAGYRPILAHPERYTIIQRDPNFMFKLAESGVLGSVTAMALTGQQGARYEACARILVEHGMVQFIASDSHDIGNRYNRLPIMSEGLAVAASIIGQERAERMVTSLPQRIVDDEPIAINAREYVPKKKGFFEKMLGRK